MNQEKIGRFIASCRKERGLTQARLAERLGITDRAVSKWENGKSLPDASIMLELCDLLKITVNELLSGERLDMDDYRKMAEENIVELRAYEEASNKRLLSLEVVVGYTSSAAFLALVFTASFAENRSLPSPQMPLKLLGSFSFSRLTSAAGHAPRSE